MISKKSRSNKIETSNKSVEFSKSARTKVFQNFMSFPSVSKFPSGVTKKISTFFSLEVDGSKNAGVTKFFASRKIEFFKKLFL